MGSTIKTIWRQTVDAQVKMWSVKPKAYERNLTQAAKLHHLASASVSLQNARHATGDLAQAFGHRSRADVVTHTSRVATFAGAAFGSLLTVPLDALIGTSRRSLAAPMQALEGTPPNQLLCAVRRALDVGVIGALGLFASVALSAVGAAIGALVGAMGAALLGPHLFSTGKPHKTSLFATMAAGATLGAVAGDECGCAVAYIARMGVELARVGTGFVKSAAMTAGAAAGAAMGTVFGAPVGLVVLAAGGLDNARQHVANRVNARRETRGADGFLHSPQSDSSASSSSDDSESQAPSSLRGSVPSTPRVDETHHAFSPRLARRLSRRSQSPFDAHNAPSSADMLRALLGDEDNHKTSPVASHFPLRLTQPL